jgi:hypothetical protein
LQTLGRTEAHERKRKGKKNMEKGSESKMISDTDCVEHSTAATTAGGEKTSAYSVKDHTAPPAAQNIVMSSRDNDSLFSGGGIR